MARKPKTEASPPITAYKGLDSNFQCRGFLFEVGKTYTVEGKIVACRNGFHAVAEDNPLHVWDFYPVIGDDGNLARYAEVEMSGATDTEKADGGTKIAAASITIKAELTLPGFIKRAITSIMSAAKGTGKETVSDGYSATLAASGYSAKLAASGKDSVIASSSRGATAKGADGTWVSLAEYDANDRCIGFSTGCIGQDGLLAETWYRAENGKLVAA